MNFHQRSLKIGGFIKRGPRLKTGFGEFSSTEVFHQKNEFSSKISFCKITVSWIFIEQSSQPKTANIHTRRMQISSMRTSAF